MNKNIVIQFFRYLWIASALLIIFFIISQSFYTKRSLEYNLDFSKSITKDIRGWYPEQRITNLSISSVYGAYDVIAEPLYMKVYTPIDFASLTITGGLQTHVLEDVKIGVRQLDSSWDFQSIDVIDGTFSNIFNLENAQVNNNQLEIILSIPELQEPNRISLINNWKIILSR